MKVIVASCMSSGRLSYFSVRVSGCPERRCVRV